MLRCKVILNYLTGKHSTYWQTIAYISSLHETFRRTKTNCAIERQFGNRRHDSLILENNSQRGIIEPPFLKLKNRCRGRHRFS